MGTAILLFFFGAILAPMLLFDNVVDAAPQHFLVLDDDSTDDQVTGVNYDDLPDDAIDILVAEAIREYFQPRTRSSRRRVDRFMSPANVNKHTGDSNLVLALAKQMDSRRNTNKQYSAKRRGSPSPTGSKKQRQRQKAVEWERVDRMLQARRTSTGFG